MHGKRTLAWYWTRLELGIGGVAVLLLLAAMGWPGPFIDPRPPVSPGPIAIPAEIAVRVVGLLVALVGLVWMIRIFRGLREDEPPPWRYRDD